MFFVVFRRNGWKIHPFPKQCSLSAAYDGIGKDLIGQGEGRAQAVDDALPAVLAALRIGDHALFLLFIKAENVHRTHDVAGLASDALIEVNAFNHCALFSFLNQVAAC